MNQESENTTLHRYVEAFNRRDPDGMSRLFASNLKTVHPAEPEVDVTCANAFLSRMRELWTLGIHYKLLRVIARGDVSADAETWGEVLVYDAQNNVMASELIIYKIHQGLVCEICVYKHMFPTHPAYQA